MSMYPSATSALINAFNTTLFDSYKASGWQRLASDHCDKYKELDSPTARHRNFDSANLNRQDWATQAGMVSGLLRGSLSTIEYSLLKCRYTFDGEMLNQQSSISVRIEMTDNLRNALIEYWPVIQEELRRHPEIPHTVSCESSTAKLQYLGLRALRPDVVKTAFRATGSEAQRTIDNHQCKVKRAVNEIVQDAYNKAECVLEWEGLTKRYYDHN